MNDLIKTIHPIADELQFTLDIIEGAILSGDYKEAQRMAEKALHKSEEKHWIDIFEGVIERIEDLEQDDQPISQELSVSTQLLEKQHSTRNILEPSSSRETELSDQIFSDDLTLLSGVGPAMAERLKREGYSTFDKLAQTNPQKLCKVKGIGTTTAIKIISSAQNRTSIPSLSQPKQKRISVNSSIPEKSQYQSLISDSDSKEYDTRFLNQASKSLHDKSNPEAIYDSSETNSNCSSPKPKAEVERTLRENEVESETKLFNEDQVSIASEPEVVDKNFNVEGRNSLIYRNETREGEKAKQKETSLKMISKTFTANGYFLLQKRLYTQGIDGVASKVFLNSSSKPLLLLIPYKVYSSLKRVIISEKDIRIQGAETNSIRTRLEVPLLNSVDIFNKKICNDSAIATALSQEFQGKVSLHDIRIRVEPVLITARPPGFTEKAIAFAYQRQSNLHAISASQLASFIDFLEKKLQYIDMYALSSQKMVSTKDTKEHLNRNIRRLSYPVISYGTLLSLVIGMGWYSALKYFVVIGYAALVLFIGGIILLLVKHRKYESQNPIENPFFHAKKITFEEGDLALIREELDLEQMAQFSYECFGKDIPNKIVEDVEKLQIKRMNVTSEKHSSLFSTQITQESEKTTDLPFEKLHSKKNGGIIQGASTDRPKSLGERPNMQQVQVGTKTMVGVEEKEENDGDLIAKYRAFLND